MPCCPGLSIDKIEKYEAADILGFSTWIAREVERITKLFETTSVAPTPEERRAGVDKLSFGCLAWWITMLPVWG